MSRALRIGKTWEVAAWEIAHLGSCQDYYKPVFDQFVVLNNNKKSGLLYSA